MDNLSAHWTAEIRAWALASNVGLLATPTNASHLNRIWVYRPSEVGLRRTA
jgi:hypothetical protein